MTIEITRPDIAALIQRRLRATEEPRRTGADLIAAIQSSPYREISLEVPSEVLPVRDQGSTLFS
jgi:hypothetical protein